MVKNLRGKPFQSGGACRRLLLHFHFFHFRHLQFLLLHWCRLARRSDIGRIPGPAAGMQVPQAAEIAVAPTQTLATQPDLLPAEKTAAWAAKVGLHLNRAALGGLLRGLFDVGIDEGLGNAYDVLVICHDTILARPLIYIPSTSSLMEPNDSRRRLLDREFWEEQVEG